MDRDSDKENTRRDDRGAKSVRDERKIPAGVLKKRAQLPPADRNKIDRDSSRVAELLRALDEQEAEHQLEIDELDKKRTEDLTALWDEHWRRVNEIEELHAEQEKYTDHLRETLREMEKENSELRDKLKGNEPLLLQISEMEEKVTLLADGVAAKDSEIEALKSELENKIDKIRHLEERHRQHTAELASMEKKLTKPKNDEKIKSLEDQIQELERQNSERGMLVRTQKQLIESKEEMLQEMKNRVMELEDAVDRAQNVEQLQQQLLREKQEKNDNLIHLVEEQREQISKLSIRDDKSEDTSRWERGSATSQGYPNGAIRRSPVMSPYERPPKNPHRSVSGYSSMAEEAPRYYSHLSDDRSGYESDDRKGSIVDARSKTPSRKEWADLADQNHQPPSPAYESRLHTERVNTHLTTRKPSTTSTSTLARSVANKAPLHPATKRYEASSTRAPAPAPGSRVTASAALRSTTSSTGILRQAANSRSSTVSDSPSKQSWRMKSEEGGSTRLEQLKSQLQDARSERLRIQARKRV